MYCNKTFCEKEELADIIDNIPDGVIMIDKEGYVKYVNGAYLDLLGLSGRNITGTHISELEKLTRFPSVARTVLKSGEEMTIDQNFISTGKTMLVSARPVKGGDGRVKKVVCIVRDITELQNLKKEWNEVNLSNKQYIKLIEALRKQLSEETDGVGIIAGDKKTYQIIKLIDRISKVNETILITGETGVGKEIFAKAVYNSSGRAGRQYVKVNCAAIPENLLESELFGYERGAFTSARKEGKAGLFETADQGTLFLDEVAEIPMHLQAKLLRAIQEKKIMRIGSVSPVKVDVRLICATNQNLEDMVKNKLFREDLYYRLNVLPIHIPPLRERKGDIIPLIDHFVSETNNKYGMKKKLSTDAYAVFYRYNWPGNVRELRNIIERVMIISPEDIISEADAMHTLELKSITHDMYDENGSDESQEKQFPVVNLKDIIEETEKRYIIDAYKTCKGLRQAARMLSMDPATYLRKFRKYSVDQSDEY